MDKPRKMKGMPKGCRDYADAILEALYQVDDARERLRAAQRELRGAVRDAPEIMRRSVRCFIAHGGVDGDQFYTWLKKGDLPNKECVPWVKRLRLVVNNPPVQFKIKTEQPRPGDENVAMFRPRPKTHRRPTDNPPPDAA
jgi:hypothetical protein